MALVDEAAIRDLTASGDFFVGGEDPCGSFCPDYFKGGGNLINQSRISLRV